MSRKYRCPHCKHVQRATPAVDVAVRIECQSCTKRFRIPKAKGLKRRPTSIAQASVREQVAAQTEALRNPSQKERLEQILEERKFGDYDILDELGRGGMGVVFRAFHRSLKRMVALKVVLPEGGDRATLNKRFQREAELHARLNHPHIVHVYDSGNVDGIQYFAMDFVTGTQLSKIMGSPEFTLERRVEVARQVADALEHAHKHGVVHRDIKPDNIIVDAGWHAHLVDFGIAKPTDTSGMESITRQGLAVGTPHYMAPEQFRPKLGKIGPRSDVYALGAVLYHALAGRPPYEANTAHHVLIKAATENPPPLEGVRTPSDEALPPDLIAIVEHCLQKEPESRYATARAFANDLERFSMGAEVNAYPLSDAEVLRRNIRKHRKPIRLFIAVAVVLLLLSGLLGAVLGLSRATLSTSQGHLSDIRESLEEQAKDNRSLNDPVDELKKLERKVEHSGAAFILTLVGISLAVVMLLVFFFVLVIRPLRRKPVEKVNEEAAPDDISETADEV